MQQAEPGPRRIGTVSGDRGIDRIVVGTEFGGDEFEEGEPVLKGKGSVAIEDQARECDARGFAAPGNQVFAEPGEVGRARRPRQIGAGQADKVSATVADGLDEIADWDELRRRIQPTDRRCFAFFHPALLDEPLIFVEVALTNAIAPAIQPILADGREPVPARSATTAIFYSISNCQKGLAGVTFGNFLIKQVVEDLAREIPSLKTFVTLSPVPGFRTWLDRERGADAPQGLTREDVEALRLLDTEDWRSDKTKCEAVRRAMLPAAAAYFLRAKNEKGRPLDPVARFHLGNGARLERMNFLGDTSKKGLKQSYGLMVNYLYDLSAIEKNHETYVNLGTVATSSAVSRELRSNLPPPRAVVLAEAG